MTEIVFELRSCRIDNSFYTEDMLHDAQILKKFGFNAREIRFLAENPWWDLKSLYTEPYLARFSDEYDPFANGSGDLDKRMPFIAMLLAQTLREP